MSRTPSNKINIFLSADMQAVRGYFNQHDPAPIYKRQLSHEFEQYIMASILTAKRHSSFHYRICLKDENDRQYIDPLMYSIRGHFTEKKQLKLYAFEKFKRRTYILLFVSLAIVMVCHGIVPLILKGQNSINTGLANSMDIFSWVILWQPIDKLIFHWNPYLKDISIMDRLAKADITVLQNEN